MGRFQAYGSKPIGFGLTHGFRIVDRLYLIRPYIKLIVRPSIKLCEGFFLIG